VDALSSNPLVDQLGLGADDDDDYDRAMALIEVVLDAGQQLKENDGIRHFALLDNAFGLEGQMQRQYQLSAARMPVEELIAVAGLLSRNEYDEQLSKAIDALAREIVSLAPSTIRIADVDAKECKAGDVC
jgi:hypothetical protein